MVINTSFLNLQIIDERKNVGDASDHITRLDLDGIQVGTYDFQLPVFVI